MNKAAIYAYLYGAGEIKVGKLTGHYPLTHEDFGRLAERSMALVLKTSEP